MRTAVADWRMITSSDAKPHTSPVLTSVVTSSHPSNGVSTAIRNQPEEVSVDIIVAGSVAVDSVCDYAPSAPKEVSPLHFTSNPAVIKQTIGGVGRNVAVAAHLLGASVRLCSLIGNDLTGDRILQSMKNL